MAWRALSTHDIRHPVVLSWNVFQSIDEEVTSMSVKYKPDGLHTVTPYLVVRDVTGLIQFLEQAFDAKETERTQLPGGQIMHAQVTIGDSVVMMGEASEDNPTRTAMLHLYVEDADATYRQALAAGATSLREPQDEFYGDRGAGVSDAFGNQWWLATHIEDVSPEEMQRRMEHMATQQ
jgi:PhnB protein